MSISVAATHKKWWRFIWKENPVLPNYWSIKNLWICYFDFLHGTHTHYCIGLLYYSNIFLFWSCRVYDVRDYHAEIGPTLNSLTEDDQIELLTVILHKARKLKFEVQSQLVSLHNLLSASHEVNHCWINGFPRLETGCGELSPVCFGNTR